MELKINPSLALSSGGTEIFLSGKMIPEVLDLSCAFRCGERVYHQNAKWHSSYLASCITPDFTDIPLFGETLPIAVALSSKEIDLNVLEVRIL